MDTDYLTRVLQKVRDGDAKEYTEGMNFGYALGMIHAYPVIEYLRLLDLLNNAAKYASSERLKAAIEAIKEAA
jgi:hypothetical protein